VVRESTGWQPTDEPFDQPVASLDLDQDTAWRLFTLGITPERARATSVATGDQAITDTLLGMVSIIA